MLQYFSEQQCGNYCLNSYFSSYCYLIGHVHPITRRSLADAAMLDEETKTDLINFSYNLCIGNMDEAFRSVKKVAGNSSIWENMAHMCVKTQVRVGVCACACACG